MKEEKGRSRQMALSHRPTRGANQQVMRPPSDGSQSAALGPVMPPEGAEHPRSTPTRHCVPRAPAAGQRAHYGLTTHLPWELHQIAFLCSSNVEENASAGVNERILFQRQKGQSLILGMCCSIVPGYPALETGSRSFWGVHPSAHLCSVPSCCAPTCHSAKNVLEKAEQGRLGGSAG